ncbi:MAG: hypothetical protein V2J24_04865 [Pseudomonadales bacterium]|jgi:hypothetical protein|nr:hypothetical protein [Pseudomonadales bacterium]
MTREARHNISIFALGTIVLTAAALAQPADEDTRATSVEQPTQSAEILDAGSATGH